MRGRSTAGHITDSLGVQSVGYTSGREPALRARWCARSCYCPKRAAATVNCMALDPRHVTVFRSVVRHGSYTGAAKELGYSQPAISQQMRALEKGLGTPLFIRTGRRLMLTEAGNMLESHVDPILDGLAQAENRVRAIVEMQAGTIRICAFPSASTTLIPAAISHILAAHPSVRIELLEAEPPECFDLLRSGACDLVLAFAYESEDEPDDDFLRVPLVTDELVVLAPASHALADQGTVKLADLAEEAWITGCPRCSVHFREVCNEAGFEPDIVCAIDDNLSVQSLVASGLGVSLMPSLVVSFLRHDLVTTLPLTPPLTRMISAYTWSNSTEMPIVRHSLETLQLVAADYQ